ncbi:TAP-like protein-domain-containing protein [Aspergillus pseudoustus]|uniref:TAP-like protein-domain-containing protein n=1 Tax=Aspergillus pseudoustus TaxID=1810923 RepID=A0ABR4KM76_9EURO
MVPFRALLPTLALLATADCTFNWTTCDPAQFDSSAVPVSFQCGTLDVPFDYTSHNSSEKLRLKLIKAPAPLKSKGTILFNFGGPGVANRDDFTTLAPTLIPLTGGQFDLMTFDTRGTVDTIPLKCHRDPVQQYRMFFSQKPSNSSETSLGELWARGTADAEACSINAGKSGGVLTTAFVARDLMQVVDALEEDSLLRYYGFSYGTVLGTTTAAMFPDRIDKMILDAVQNVHEYYHAQANFEEWELSDELFSTIFCHCVEAGPELCSLASYNKTPDELEAAAWDLLDAIKHQPVAVGELVVDYAALKGIFAQSLYSQRFWPSITTVIDYLAFGGENAAIPLGTILSGLPAINTTASDLPRLMNGDSALAGIYCGDNQVRTGSFADFLPVAEKLYRTSSVMGDVPMGSYARCQQWRIEPKETYTGDFEVQTRNPVLFVGNTLDGHTPLKSAYNVSSGFEGSVVLEVDGYGHGSSSVPSQCSLKTISAYWVNGTLPESGTRCERSVEPFTSDWWPKVFKDAGVNASWIAE